MTEFCIETYINNLPENTEIINVNGRQLNYLPDLTRFTNLQILLPMISDNTKIFVFNKSIK